MPKVIIIEDDSLVARMYQQAFKAEGFGVATASNGAEGVKKVAVVKPDLVLLDVMMPKMNGLEVLEKLKANDELKDIPVVMLTNLAGTQDAQKAKEAGAKAYLVKSEYKPREVVEKVKGFLGK